MSLTEQGAQTAQTVATQLLNTGVRLTVKVTHLSITTILRALKDVRLTHKQTGRVKLKNLTTISGGDVHPQKIDPDLHKTLVKELKARGVTFSVEHAPDGNLYVHFAGKDLPTLEHAIAQAEARLEKSQKPTEPEKTKPDTPVAATKETVPEKTPATTMPERQLKTQQTPTQKVPTQKQDVVSRIKARAKQISARSNRAPKPVKRPSKGTR